MPTRDWSSAALTRASDGDSGPAVGVAEISEFLLLSSTKPSQASTWSSVELVRLMEDRRDGELFNSDSVSTSSQSSLSETLSNELGPMEGLFPACVSTCMVVVVVQDQGPRCDSEDPARCATIISFSGLFGLHGPLS